MKVKVGLYTGLRRYAPETEDALCVEVPDACCVVEVLKILGIPAEEEEKVILINGRPAREDSVLQEGDALVLFSPLAGG